MKEPNRPNARARIRKLATFVEETVSEMGARLILPRGVRQRSRSLRILMRDDTSTIFRS